MNFRNSRGQQNKGPNYDTTLDFFDEIDPQVSELSQNRYRVIFSLSSSLLQISLKISQAKIRHIRS